MLLRRNLCGLVQSVALYHQFADGCRYPEVPWSGFIWAMIRSPQIKGFVGMLPIRNSFICSVKVSIKFARKLYAGFSKAVGMIE